MADRPGSFRSHNKVSRHTMVMRKAKDDNARRLTETDEARRLEEEASAPAPRSGRTRVDRGATSRAERRVSGRTVVVQREGEASRRLSVTTRLEGERAASIRVTGGDTIIRYESGDMVIRRGARRAQLRRQLIWAYALGYLLLFGTYGYFLLTGTSAVTPEAFIDRAFAMRHSSTVPDLERAAFEAMRGNRTPAEVRVAEPLSFYDENGDLVHVEAGSRLTLVTAATLGKAILDDMKKDPSKRNFNKPIRLYNETYLANMNWPHWLSMYNSLGFFLLLVLFLWRPILNYLGTQAKKTEAAVRNARDAQDEAQEYREKYRRLADDIARQDGEMRTEAEAGMEADKAEALKHAKIQAEELEGSIRAALETEARTQVGQIGARAAAAACDRARAVLTEKLGQADHDAAIDELIADILAMKPAGN